MTTLPNMLLVLPTRGAPGSGTWDDAIDAALALIDAHDHSAGKGTLVPTAGLNINADLSFAGLWAPVHLHRITFDSVAALSSNNKSFFVSDGTGGLVSGELYWRTNSGSNVRVTNGAALNVTAFAGGIGGDYAAVGAAVAFDDANDRYTFKQQGGTWARMASGEVRILETGTSESLYVGLVCPSALAGSYAITLPLAAPGSTSIVQMDSSGVLTASNTVANAVTLSGALTVNNTVTTNNTITTTSTVATTGANLTSNGNRVQLKAPGGLAANYDVTMPAALPASTQVMRLSSSGVVTAATGTENRVYGAVSAVPSSVGGTRQSGASAGGGFVNLGTSTGVNWLPLNVSVGEIITSWSVLLTKTSATGTISAQLIETDGQTLADTAVGTGATNGANNPGSIQLSEVSLSKTVAVNKLYWISLNGGGTTGDSLKQYQCTVTVSP